MRNLLCVFAALALLGSVVEAATDLSWGGQVRLREQTDRRSFAPDYEKFSFDEMRTRLHVAATVDSNAHAFIELQDSRILGGSNEAGQPLSGTTNDGRNVDLHQGYVRIDNIFGEGWGGQGGRFEFVRGNQRVFGSVGWSNVGRSFDGAMLWYDQPAVNVTGFLMVLRDLLKQDDAGDFRMLGLYSTIKKVNLDLFAFFEGDHQNTGWPADMMDLNRLTLGTYFRRAIGQGDIELNAAYQTGRKTDPNVVRTERLDIAAFMFTFEAGLSFAGERHGRVSAGVDYSSGDDDPNDGDYNTYQNSYYTGHKFRGHMDYFVSSDTHGLIDLLVRGKMDPIRGWTCRADIHYFATAVDYPSVIDSSAHRALGTEIDLAVQARRVKGVVFEAGLSVFVPDKAGTEIVYPTAVPVTDPSTAYWAYSLATLAF